MIGIYETVYKNNIHLVVYLNKQEIEDWVKDKSANYKTVYIFDPFGILKVNIPNNRIIKSSETVRNAIHNLIGNRKFKNCAYIFTDPTQFLKCSEFPYSLIPVYILSSLDMFLEFLRKNNTKIDLKCKFIETNGYC